MAKNLVIFDCDGVLVDSEYISSTVFSETLTRYGYPLSVEEAIRRFSGVSEHSCREVVMQETNLSIPEDYWAREHSVLMKIYERELTPLLQPVLERLHSLEIPHCVASNSSRNYVMHCLDCTDQMRYFTEETIFTSEQVMKPKPAPDLFLFAAEKMGVVPENCIVVEDSFTGAEAAIAAGMHVLMFVGGKHAHYEWYQSRIATYGKNMLSTSQELWDAIQVSLPSYSQSI